MKTAVSTFFLLLFFLTGFSQIKSFRSNIYIVPPDGSDPVLMDGTLSFFDNQYSDAVDRMDARKMFNPGENWGMTRGDYVLIVERKSDIKATDTIFFKFWNSRVITYRLEFLAKYFDSTAITATLIDKYLQKRTPVSLSGPAYVDFQVTADPGSKMTDRFMLVFNNAVSAGLMPLNFVSASAVYTGRDVRLNWVTANERNVKEYTIQKSTDGSHFRNTGLTLPARNTASASYEITEANPAAGVSFYRILATDLDGQINYSSVMKVSAGTAKTEVMLMPNPTTASDIRIRLNSAQSGAYRIALYGADGRMVLSQTENAIGGINDIRLRPDQSLPAGIYRVEVSGPDEYHQALNLMIRN